MENIKNKLIELTNLLENEEEIQNENYKIRIVILQRGWIIIGKVKLTESMCLIQNGFTIRCWGTQHGLGQLALEGKQVDTILDKFGRGSFHILTSIQIIECDETKWNL